MTTVEDPGVTRAVFASSEAGRPGVRERLDATRSLVRSTRRLMRAVATTAVDPAEIADVTRSLDDAASRLERRQRSRPLRISLDDVATARVRDGEAWEHFAFNPLGITMRMTLDGDTLRARLALEPHHEGPPDLLHGGFSAALMDALLGTLVQVQGIVAVTADLGLRFRAGVDVAGTVDLGGRIVGVEGRKVTAEGWIDHQGVRCVEARALFVAVDREPG